MSQSPQHPAGPYGQPPLPPSAATAPIVRPTSQLALASMVVALGSFVACAVAPLPYGIAGAIMGHVAKRRIAAQDLGGAGMALTGIIVGWIQTVASLVALGALAFLLIRYSNGT